MSFFINIDLSERWKDQYSARKKTLNSKQKKQKLKVIKIFE